MGFILPRFDDLNKEPNVLFQHAMNAPDGTAPCTAAGSLLADNPRRSHKRQGASRVKRTWLMQWGKSDFKTTAVGTTAHGFPAYGILPLESACSNAFHLPHKNGSQVLSIGGRGQNVLQAAQL